MAVVRRMGGGSGLLCSRTGPNNVGVYGRRLVLALVLVLALL